MKKATIILALVAATLTGCTTSKQATTDEQRNYISWIAFCANRGYNINDNTFPAVNEDLGRGRKGIYQRGGRTLLNHIAMTDFDKKLIEKAEKFSRWNYRNIDVLISIADTEEAVERLRNLRWELYDLVQETL